MSSQPVVLAVDGNSLAHRAYHAYTGRGVELTDRDGRPTGAVYGFLALLAGIADKVVDRYRRLDAVVVGFDDTTSSVRKAEYPGYKAQRERKDDALVDQLARIVELLPSLGVHVVVPDGLEADDVIGSTAAAAESGGWRCVIATSDRDSFSQISDTTVVLRLVSGLDNAVWLDPATLSAKYGVAPGAYTRFAAVRGDTSDNLPGVPGVGEKRAAALWARFATWDDAVGDPGSLAGVVGKRAAATMTDPGVRAVFERNMSLMAIRRDVPVDLAAAVLHEDPNIVASVVRSAGFPAIAGRLAGALTPSALAAGACDDGFDDRFVDDRFGGDAVELDWDPCDDILDDVHAAPVAAPVAAPAAAPVAAAVRVPVVAARPVARPAVQPSLFG